MIDAEDLDRVRAVLGSIEGVQGFALALSYQEKIEVLLSGLVSPEASGQAIIEVAKETREAAAQERPLRLN